MQMRGIRVTVATIVLFCGFSCKPGERDPNWTPNPGPKMIRWFQSLKYSGFKGTTFYELGYPKWFNHGKIPRPEMSVEAVELGRYLFYDKSLSSDGTIACASCHQQKANFADNRRFSPGVKGRTGHRNSMPLVNLVMDQRFFWDGRAASLEEQVLMPIEDNAEMDLPIDELISRLNRHPIYPKLFERAYNIPVIDREHVANALAQFVKSIISYSSIEDYYRAFEDRLIGFDEIPFAMRKDIPAYKKNIRIMNCGPCHTLVLESGQNTYEDVGLEENPKDTGYYKVTGKEQDRGKFKTPTLRNLKFTAPYMHDGRFATIEEVVKHYRKDMKRKANISPLYLDKNNRIKSHSLTDEEVAIIFSMIEFDIDEKVLTDPKYADPF